MIDPSDHAAAFLADRPEDLQHTTLWSPFAHVARELRAVVTDLVDRARPLEGATIVDLGCADTPYRDLFVGARYVGVDLPGNPRASVELAPDGTVPLADGSVDLVLSTQVLEHVIDPTIYLRECARLLRPGGQLVLTTHGIMYLHRDPTDYWRWTCDGLAKIVEASGLEVVERRGVLGLVGASLQLLQAGLSSRCPRRLRKPLVVVFQILIRASDRFTTEAGRLENGLVLAVRATKPDDGNLTA